MATPHILDLYKHYYGRDKKIFFDALGISMSSDALEWARVDDVIKKVNDDPAFVTEKRIQALHEAATLPYPSNILALAMGVGTTVLIGTIVATGRAVLPGICERLYWFDSLYPIHKCVIPNVREDY